MDTSVPGPRAGVTPAGIDLPTTEPVNTPAPEASAFTPPAQPAPTPADLNGDAAQPAPTDVANTRENPLQSNAQPANQPVNQPVGAPGQLPPVIAGPETGAPALAGASGATGQQVAAVEVSPVPTPGSWNPFSRIFSGARVLLKSPSTTGDNTSTLTNASEPARDAK
jgi:hypothetical protein